MGAKCYAIMEEKGLRPKETHSLGTLRCLMSTGSPLKPTSFDFIYRDVKDDLLLASISGTVHFRACLLFMKLAYCFQSHSRWEKGFEGDRLY